MSAGFGARIREEREKMGLSQLAFAELGGVKKNSQINYEADRTSPTAEYLLQLSKHGVDAAYVLLGRRGEEVGEGRFDPSSKDWTFLYIKRIPASNDPEEAVPVRREWLEKAGLASVAGLWLTYMPEGVGMGGDYPNTARPGDMIICRNAFGLQEGRPYLFEYEGVLRAGHLHGVDGLKILLPGRTSAEIATADDVIMVGEIRGKLGISEVK